MSNGVTGCDMAIYHEGWGTCEYCDLLHSSPTEDKETYERLYTAKQMLKKMITDAEEAEAEAERTMETLEYALTAAKRTLNRKAVLVQELMMLEEDLQHDEEMDR